MMRLYSHLQFNSEVQMLAKIISRRLLAHRNPLYFFSKDPFDKFNRKKDAKPNDDHKTKENDKHKHLKNEKSARTRLQQEHKAPSQTPQQSHKEQEETNHSTGFQKFGSKHSKSAKSAGEERKESESERESEKPSVNGEDKHEDKQEDNTSAEPLKRDQQSQSFFKEEVAVGKGFERFNRKKPSPLQKQKEKRKRTEAYKKQAQQNMQGAKQQAKADESKKIDIPKIKIDLNSDNNDDTPILRKSKTLKAKQQKQQSKPPERQSHQQQTLGPNGEHDPNKIWQQFQHEKEKFKSSYKHELPRYERLNLFKQSKEKKPEKASEPVNHRKNFTSLVIAGLGLMLISNNEYFKWSTGTEVDPQFLKQAIDEDRIQQTWIQNTESDLQNDESVKGKNLKSFIYIREKNGQIYYCVSNHQFEQIWFDLVEAHNQVIQKRTAEPFPIAGAVGSTPEVRRKITMRPKQQDKNSSLVGDARSMLSMVLLYFFIKSIMEVSKGAKGKGGKGVSGLFENQKSHRFKEVIKVTFQDVVGMQKSKDEIVEFIDFLKHPQKYNKLGARIPKGALLTGPPGTGKTMIAKACAGESKVPFFTISGSEFIEMYVGVGAQRVRNLFKQAKENAPSIIFIDEIDAVGKKRSGMGGGGGNDERDTTLNQLLVEMDGFDTNTNVIVFAATNQKEVLDPALTRPGRFDRLIEVELPDLEGRREIFEVHLKPLVLDGHVDIKDYAKRLATLTPGFSGADIKNVCNQAAIIAARNNKEHVSIIDFELATERIIGGVEKRSQLITPQTRKTVAYHECGHGVVSWFIENANPLLKLTIIPRSKGALGFAQYLPNEHQMFTKKKLLDEISVILGGRVAEQVFFGKISTGASDDLNKAYQIAKAFVTQYGFGDKLGWIQYGETEYAKEYSKQIENKIDAEILEIMRVCSERTRTIVHQKRELIHRLAQKLLELETIDQNIITAILGERPFKMSKQHEEYIKEKKRITEEVAILTQATQSEAEKGQAAMRTGKRSDWVL